MSLETILALSIFAVVTSITPGPNNTMLLASGVNFGYIRTLPHMVGIGAGFFSLLIGVGFGLGALIVSFPAVHLFLKIAGSAYLVWIAWQIGSARSMGEVKETGLKPMTFIQAAAFQWINPKAWFMAITAMTTYADPARPFLSVLLVGSVFAVINMPTVSTWAAFGSVMRGWLSDPVRLKWFNISMAVLLLCSLWPLLT